MSHMSEDKSVTEFLTVLQDIIQHRPDDVPRLIKILENLKQRLKQPECQKHFIDQDAKAKALLIKSAVQAYCHALVSTKLARTLDKVLKSLPELYNISFAEEIENVLRDLIERHSLGDLKMLSALLDQNIVAKTASENCFVSISHMLKRALETRKDQAVTKNLSGAEEYIRLTVKLCVQVLQLHPKRIRSVMGAVLGQEHEIPAEMTAKPLNLLDIWRTVIRELLTLLIQSSSKDISLLTGTALAMIFNLAPSQSMSHNLFMDVISLLTGVKTVFCLDDQVIYDADQTLLDIPEDTSLSLITVIKGLLVSCPKETLSCGDKPLILKVYPYILHLCQGPAVHHYLTFQLLALWYHKLEHVGKLQFAASAVKPLKMSLTSPKKGHGICTVGSSASGKLFTCAGSVQRSAEERLIDHQKDQREEEICGKRDKIETGIEKANSGYQGRDKLSYAMHADTIVNGSRHEEENFSVPSQSSVALISRKCPVLRSTLSCIWLNWDSPVDGVSEFVIETFSCLLRVWHQCVKDGSSDYIDLCQHLMDRVLSMAWQARTRYWPLCLLLPYVNCTKLLQEQPKLKADLLRCMKTNHMAAIASDVYKAFLQQLVINDESDALKQWTVVWMPTLLQGLTSADSLQRLKTCTYWLAPTFKTIVGSHNLLLDTLEEHLRSDDDPRYYQWLFAWVTVSRIVREFLHMSNTRQAPHLLEEALFCDDEEIRGEAVMFLCSSVKKAEPMTKTEADLLQKFIPANLKTDSAPFRQNLTSALRKMFVRIRDSCLSAVKNKKAGETFLDHSIDFINWLSRLLMMSLGCGGSYQRRQTTFDLLWATLETFIYLEQDLSKKGKAQEASHILVAYAQSRGQWNFFSDDNFLTVLMCLEDGAEEIQTQAYSRLLKFFDWPKAICYNSLETTADQRSEKPPATSPGQDTEEVANRSTSLLANSTTIMHLLSRAFSLTSSPRAYENHSGLLMMSLVLNRYIMDLGVTFSHTDVKPGETVHNTKLSLQSVTSTSTDICGNEVAHDPTVSFLDLLTDKVKISLEAVLDDLGATFKSHPIHGVTQCITRCLKDITRLRKGAVDKVDKWKGQLEVIVTLNQRIIALMLEVLAGKKSLANCPSFADMGVALASLLSGDQDQEEEAMSLSPEFQLLLSWCWLNLRESCSCLGEVTSAAVGIDKKNYLSHNILTSIGQTFVKILTMCRHRGAIEGCRSGLLQFSTVLMSSNDAALADIPKAMLQQIVANISENSLTSSVTRRSAGLPIVVQTVLQADRRCGNSALLTSTVEELYSVASQPLPADHSQHQDLSQSHALNILKVIFCDASLAPFLMPLLSQVTILVVEGFDSPSWAIRNAATQLISTLVTRIFGQKNKETNSSFMTLEEFGAQYPQLLQFICDRLKSFKESQNVVKPSVYILLTLLSGLGMAPLRQHSLSCRDFLQRAVLSFLPNPVYSLRKLSAQAYIALSPLDAGDNRLREILDKIKQRRLRMNELHGWLLSAHFLLCTGVVSTEAYKHLLAFIVDNSWLLLHFQSCFVPLTTVLSMIQQAVAVTDPDDHLLKNLWDLVNDVISSIRGSKNCLLIDRDNCIRQCIKTLAAVNQVRASSSHGSASHFSQLMQDNLSSALDDMRAAVLNRVCADTALAKDENIQRAVLENLLKETNMSNFIQSVQIFVALSLGGDLHLQAYDPLKIDVITQKKKWGQAQRVQAAIFALEGIMISKGGAMEERCGSVCDWCQQLMCFSDPTANENLRMTAAQLLRIAGKKILKFCTSNRNLDGVDYISCSIIKASLVLLEDTEEDVRHEVAAFVSRLQDSPLRHYNLCYSLLSKFICEHLSWLKGIFGLLLNMLYSAGQLSRTISAALSTRSQALFEPETSSAMAEVSISKIWAYDTLRSAMKRGTQKVAMPLLHDVVILAGDELSGQMLTIENNLLSEPIFNISTDQKVLECLFGIILLTLLHTTEMELPEKSASSGEASENVSHEDTLSELVTKLQQIPSVHPLLRTRHFETCPPLVCNLLPSM